MPERNGDSTVGSSQRAHAGEPSAGASSGESTEQLQHKAHEAASVAQEKAQQVGGELQARAREELGRRTSQASEQLGERAQDLRAVGNTLREQGKDGPAKAA